MYNVHVVSMFSKRFYSYDHRLGTLPQVVRLLSLSTQQAVPLSEASSVSLNAPVDEDRVQDLPAVY